MIGIIAAIAVAAVVVVCLFVLPLVNTSLSLDSTQNKNVLLLNEDGDIYALFPNKEVKEYTVGARDAGINRLGSHIAFVDGEDALYVLETSSAEKKTHR
jgi:hypothetical protein